MIARFRRRYGAGPAHLGLLVASSLVVGYAISRIVGVHDGLSILVWLAVAALLHDLVLFPLYALLDRVLHVATRWRRRRAPRAVPLVNYVRVPAILSGLMLMVAFPTILRLAPGSFTAATGLSPDVYLFHWIALAGGVWACSGLLYGARRWRSRPGHRVVRPVADERPPVDDTH